MNKILINYAFAFTLFVLVISCGKEGEVGPQGSKGDKGEQGPTGAKGEDGTSILSGAAVPTTSIGKEGDFYLNLSDIILYGPKKGTDWGKGIALSGSSGEKGEPGSDGNTILNGNGEPASSLGKVGDFYFDTKNVAIYGAKLSSGWGTPISLKSSSNSIRVLIKENVKVPKIDFSSGGGELYFSNKVYVGDVTQYLNNGAIIIQVKINNGIWSTGETVTKIDVSPNYLSVASNVSSNPSYDGEYFTFPVNAINYYDLIGDKTEVYKQFQSALEKVNISYKFILIPSSETEKLSRQFPNNKIDSKFLSKYFTLNK